MPETTLEETIDGREAVLSVLKEGLVDIESAPLTDNGAVTSLIKSLKRLRTKEGLANGDAVELSASIEELGEFVVNSDIKDIRSYPLHQAARTNAVNYVRSMAMKWQKAYDDASARQTTAARNFSMGQIVALRSAPKRIGRIVQIAKAKSANNSWYEVKMFDNGDVENLTANDIVPTE